MNASHYPTETHAIRLNTDPGLSGNYKDFSDHSAYCPDQYFMSYWRVKEATGDEIYIEYLCVQFSASYSDDTCYEANTGFNYGNLANVSLFSNRTTIKNGPASPSNGTHLADMDGMGFYCEDGVVSHFSIVRNDPDLFFRATCTATQDKPLIRTESFSTPKSANGDLRDLKDQNLECPDGSFLAAATALYDNGFYFNYICNYYTTTFTQPFCFHQVATLHLHR